MNLDEKRRFIVNFTYFSLWLLIIYFIFKVAAVYLLPFVIGILIACFVQRPASFISKKTGISKQISAAILSVLLFIFVLLFLILLIWIIYNQSDKMIKSFTISSELTKVTERIFKSLINKYENISSFQSVTIKKFTNETLDEFIKKISAYLSAIFATFIKTIPSLLISSVITIVATCYIAKDYERFYVFLKGIISEKIYKKIVDIKEIFVKCILNFLIGYFWIFLITFLELILGLLLLNIPNFVFIAFLIALVDLLPIFGTGIVLLPWAIFEVFQYNYYKGIGLSLLYLVIVIVKNFIEPKIIGKQIDINPLFTLVFIFLGLKLGGVTGMILVPIVFTVFFTYLRQEINLPE